MCSATMFAHVARDHAKPAALRAWNAGRPFLKGQHEGQTDQPNRKPTTVQPVQRAREKAWRRASSQQPLALAAADNMIKAM